MRLQYLRYIIKLKSLIFFYYPISLLYIFFTIQFFYHIVLLLYSLFLLLYILKFELSNNLILEVAIFKKVLLLFDLFIIQFTHYIIYLSILKNLKLYILLQKISLILKKILKKRLDFIYKFLKNGKFIVQNVNLNLLYKTLILKNY